MGLIRNHYVGRTFIEPTSSIRHFGVKLKLNPVPQVLKGRRVIVVDDSLVRGTTSRKIVKMIRAAGAAEVHLRISSPPVISPCYYGIDTPTRAELLASSHNPEEVARYVTADSVAYLSLEGLMQTPAPADRGLTRPPRSVAPPQSHERSQPKPPRAQQGHRAARSPRGPIGRVAAASLTTSAS